MDAKAIWVVLGTFYISWFNLAWEFLLIDFIYQLCVFPQPVWRICSPLKRAN
jgi:hypothetical protein